MERRPKPVSGRPARRIDQRPDVEHTPVDPASLPYIAHLMDHGQITIGIMPPVGCVAVAAEGRHSIAMLRRRDGESLAQLLSRLDQAIAKALHDDTFTDEINPQR